SAGNAKAVNVALIGVMAKSTDIPFDVWIDTIKTTVPPKFLELNLKAFELGYNS
ncbi:MAG: 2-oxoacid:acceptor oxidoreductase family protein, partial [Clostridia bacterium]|nr:2-oxoacid:acceptor oxidoreductase family protein [Clostridia bacterium]